MIDNIRTKELKALTLSNKYQFGGNREIAIVRDKESCVECGMTRAEHRSKFKRDITVDHIDGSGRNTPTSLRNNKLSNLQTLCLPCHGKKDALRRFTLTEQKKLYAEVLLVKNNQRIANRIERYTNQRTNKHFRGNLFTHDGQSKTLEEWCRIAECNKSTFYQRFYAYGWPLERCLLKANKRGVSYVPTEF